jgi:hypothetical protein
MKNTGKMSQETFEKSYHRIKGDDLARSVAGKILMGTGLKHAWETMRERERGGEDEAGLRRLAAQIKARKVVVKLFLRHPLHAKLYLLFRPDPINPIVGYLGSSNLTLAGLSGHGELNVDVLDRDACEKLARWFQDRWDDRWCIDISDELAQIIEESWAREALIPPYHIYIKMAYHLSQEARAGLTEFRIPAEFRHKLFEFQSAAVRIAARYLNRRGGVLIGDVVGLGKTLMATALARIFEDDFGLETLILCPRNLTPMWEDYREQYRLRGRVLSLSIATRELPKLRRYRLVLIDESHNLRNRDGQRYRAILEYVRANDSKLILLSATPYNKSYQDLANQLRLFVPEDRDLGIRPERLLREMGETEFIRKHQCAARSLAAFEKSPYVDDWRELMRLCLVRRTRTFIKDNYAEIDLQTGRKSLTFEDGSKAYFPERLPRTVKFKIGQTGDDPYARLYADEVVDVINHLNLPRYGLGNYLALSPHESPKQTEGKVIQDLSRAGKRLMGFCRTNLFKRLESSGHAFLQSVERHILRNAVFLYAISHDLPLPIGTQDAELLDPGCTDDDNASPFAENEDDNGGARVRGALERVGDRLTTDPKIRKWGGVRKGDFFLAIEQGAALQITAISQRPLREPAVNGHSEWNVSTEKSPSSGGGVLALNRWPEPVGPPRQRYARPQLFLTRPADSRIIGQGLLFLRRDSRRDHVPFPLAELVAAVVPFGPEPRPAAADPISCAASLPPSTGVARGPRGPDRDGYHELQWRQLRGVGSRPGEYHRGRRHAP